MTVEQASRLDGGLRDLALLAAAAGTGCSCGAGFGYWAPASRRQLIEEEIRAAPRWRDGEVFTRLERLVMLYAETLTMTPPLAAGGLADRLADELRERLGEAALAELAAAVTGTVAGTADAAAGETGQTRLD
jgi:alkylhydroperoxidase family enzyme